MLKTLVMLIMFIMLIIFGGGSRPPEKHFLDTGTQNIRDIINMTSDRVIF